MYCKLRLKFVLMLKFHKPVNKINKGNKLRESFETDGLNLIHLSRLNGYIKLRSKMKTLLDRKIVQTSEKTLTTEKYMNE